VTGEEKWGVPRSTLEELALVTFNYRMCSEILEALWRRLQEAESKWIVVFKCLDLLEYLVLHGSDSALEEIQRNSYIIQSFVGYSARDSEGVERGSGVRSTGSSLLNLLRDPAKLESERNKVKAVKNKLAGVIVSEASSSVSKDSGLDPMTIKPSVVCSGPSSWQSAATSEGEAVDRIKIRMPKSKGKVSSKFAASNYEADVPSRMSDVDESLDVHSIQVKRSPTLTFTGPSSSLSHSSAQSSPDSTEILSGMEVRIPGSSTLSKGSPSFVPAPSLSFLSSEPMPSIPTSTAPSESVPPGSFSFVKETSPPIPVSIRVPKSVVSSPVKDSSNTHQEDHSSSVDWMTTAAAGIAVSKVAPIRFSSADLAPVSAFESPTSEIPLEANDDTALFDTMTSPSSSDSFVTVPIKLKDMLPGMGAQMLNSKKEAAKKSSSRDTGSIVEEQLKALSLSGDKPKRKEIASKPAKTELPDLGPRRETGSKPLTDILFASSGTRP